MKNENIIAGRFYRVITTNYTYESMKIDVVALVCKPKPKRDVAYLKNIHINHNLDLADQWNAHQIGKVYAIQPKDYSIEEVTRESHPEYFL